MCKSNLFEMGAKFDDVDYSQKQKPQPQCAKILPKNEHILTMQKQKTKNNIVTKIGEFYISKQDGDKLAKKLKAKLATGGSFKNNFIILNGDFVIRAKELLKQDKWQFKN